MAKKNRKIKLNVDMPTAPPMGEKENEWQTRDDADKIRAYARLTQEKSRHKRALDHIGSEHRAMMGIIGRLGSDDLDRSGGMKPRGKGRSGRKRSARVASRRRR